MTKLIDDLSTLSSVATANLVSLCRLSEAIISHSVAESMRDGEEVTSVDIGIGTLYLKNTEDGVKYKFTPSSRMSKTIESTFKDGNSRLVYETDEVLGRRIMNTYKDLF